MRKILVKVNSKGNKDEGVHRFALRAITGELLERERERKICKII